MKRPIPPAERPKQLILGAMVANILLALVLGIVIAGSKSFLHAQFEPGFPSDMLVVRHKGRRDLRNVLLELDGRFIHRVPVLRKGTVAFEVPGFFEDEQRRSPGKGFRPHRLRVVHATVVEEIEVAARGPEDS